MLESNILLPLDSCSWPEADLQLYSRPDPHPYGGPLRIDVL
jgi:hypothetical protein